MKFKVASKALYEAFSAVSKVISSKNPMTILNNFLISVDDQRITITASDIENTLTARVAISDLEGDPMKICLDARRCVELFKELPELSVDFVVDEASLAVKIEYPGGVFDFVGINGDEYPSSRDFLSESEAVKFTCPSNVIVKGIESTLFAVGSDELRPQMMGILFDIFENDFTFVATDTRKLVKYRNWSTAPGVRASCIVPTKPAAIIRGAFAREETLSVTIDSKSAIFETPTFTLNCRLVKGNFPDYNRVIPKNNPYQLTVDRATMLNALRRMAVFVDPGHGLVKFHITPENIEMKAQDTKFCTAGKEEVACSFTGNDLVIGFSAPFLIDIFSTLSTTNAIIQLCDPSRPGVFIPEEDSKDSELIMLLMPMTVNNF